LWGLADLMDVPPHCATCRRELPRDAVVCPYDGTPVTPGVVAASVQAATPSTPPGGPGTDSLIGVQLGEYVVQARIADGGMGLVYRGLQPLIGKPVAIKVLRSDVIDNPLHVERLLAEARAVNAIRHRSIIDIFSFGRTPDGRHYVVMELLDGIALDSYLIEHGPLPPYEALEIFTEVLAAMAAAHEAQVVHRDLKPSNIFLVRQPGGGRYVKVLDFGLAKRPEESRGAPKTIDGTIVGTPAYMAPEQIRGEGVTAKTDLYSFGVMAYETLTGHLPFAGTSVADFLTGHLSVLPFDPLALRPQLPKPLAALLLRMLEKVPADRPSLAEVRAELKRFGRVLRSEVTVQAPLETRKPLRALSDGSSLEALTPEASAPEALALEDSDLEDPTLEQPALALPPHRSEADTPPEPRAAIRARTPGPQRPEPQGRSGAKPPRTRPGPLDPLDRPGLRRTKTLGEAVEGRSGGKPPQLQASAMELEDRPGPRLSQARLPGPVPEERPGGRLRPSGSAAESEDRGASGFPRRLSTTEPVVTPRMPDGFARKAASEDTVSAELTAEVTVKTPELAPGTASASPLPKRPLKQRSWPVLLGVGAAVLVALGAGVVAAPGLFGLDSEPGIHAVRPVQVPPAARQPSNPVRQPPSPVPIKTSPTPPTTPETPRVSVPAGSVTSARPPTPESLMDAGRGMPDGSPPDHRGEPVPKAPARPERKLDQRSLLRTLARCERDLRSNTSLTESEQRAAASQLAELRNAANRATGNEDLRKVSRGLDNWSQFYLRR